MTSLVCTRIRVVLGAAFATIIGASPAVADDTEIFVNPAAGAGIKPNILLILDTSGSMSETASGRAVYDPSQSYAGECPSGVLFWRSGPGEVPSCESQDRLPISANACNSATEAMADAGLWTGRLAQWSTSDAAWRWLDPAYGAAPLECEADEGVHGPDANSTKRWATNGDDDNRWTDQPAQRLDWSTSEVHTLYSSNWLNWFYFSPTDNSGVSRLDVVKAVASTLVSSVDNVNIGLMRFSNNSEDSGGDGAAEGGMVIHAMADVATARTTLTSQIMALTHDGFTPLSETLYEAGQYLAGRSVDYGVDSRINADTALPSVADSRESGDSSRYRSPIEYQCQRNYVVLLTDGLPTRDNSADSRITSLPDFASLVGGCDGTGAGRCLDEMAEYLNKADLAPGRLEGTQNATTYTIGFGPEVSGSVLLAETAAAGGGESFAANDVTELTSVFQRILTDILQTSSTFTTPSVSINAFNRTQALNELYISVFQPRETLHWPGNLKKYRLEDGKIVDQLGNDAIDPTTGFFVSGSRSYWSPTADEDRVSDGGAVSQLPDPVERDLLTELGGPIVDLNEATAATAGISLDALNWARGFDVQDIDGDLVTDEPYRSMGDPLHARPAVVTYGGSVGSPDPQDTVVFVPTNDGFLHAVNGRDGSELWAFIPREMLSRLPLLVEDPPVGTRTYGLDGDVRVLRFDANQNGVIEAADGDQVWIYFGMRRGGRYYYALNVTNRDSPELLWKIGPQELAGIGETWSPPTLARVQVDGANQNGENIVLIFGGGYDDAQENRQFTADTSGNRIFMVDAQSGELLWSAGPADADLVLQDMTHSIPARVVVIDTNGDAYADRMYAADMGGRVWRFDIFSGESRSGLVTGGVFADLGAAGEQDPSIANTRRFYYAPDVALIQRRGADPYYNIAIGSGYRGHPLDTDTQDRFYSLRDKNPFGKLTSYAGFDPIVEADLVNITSNVAGATVSTEARGWMLELRLNNGWVGEKVLAEAVTADGVILFPTYQPVPTNALNPCVPVNGRNRVYALSVDSGKPAVDFSDDGQITSADAFTDLQQTGISGEVSFLFEIEGDDGGDGDGDGNGDGDGDRDALGRRTLCLVGVEVLQQCVQPGSVVRTFWQRANDQL